MVTGSTTDPFFTSVADEDTFTLSTGHQIRIPVRYIDYSNFTITYPVSVELARSWLPSSLLQPVEITRGVSTVNFSAFDYREWDYTPYREMGVFVPVRYQSAQHPEPLEGLYVVVLPVTTQQACLGGIEMAAYPKFVADIDVIETPTSCRCDVAVDQQPAFSITIDPRVVSPTMETRVITIFTYDGAELAVSCLHTQGLIGTSTQPAEARVTLGTHAVTSRFQAIDLDQPAVACAYMPHSKALLYLPHLRLPA